MPTARGGWDFGGDRAPQSVFFRAASAVLGITVGEQDRAGTRAGQLEALLADAGCGEVQGGELTVRSTFASIQEWWEPYTLGVSPAGALVASLDAPTRARILERARGELGAGPVSVTATAWVAGGRA
ncbi:hypothetical protein [Microbacterium sp. zg-YB36]|uniref:hypothetical protein n=1 Tax=Microbacterium sp. zg-YB36 TaxID=2969407 RepID=UPI00214AF082|nr:hypothetical protein [Microbacterium sp. zg-YB36]MDL5351853.1 hypothetical protein [Microbacterium sp. zg-YB36]